MTYFGFLGLFVGLPILALLVWQWLARRQGRSLPAAFNAWPAWLVIGLHMLVAFVYTTPWDNYLVATGVWNYDPALVTGIVFGWVPIEEYTFFLVQPIMTSLLLLTLLRYLPVNDTATPVNQVRLRLIPLTLLGLLWIVAAVILLAGWRPGTYLGLELVWALPPIMFQIFFGADILWKQRRHVFGTIAVATLYLSLADTVAIRAGTWAIDPAQSLPVLLGNILPIEEFVFFLITNVLIVFGVTLVLAAESHQRVPAAVGRWLPFLVNRKIADQKEVTLS
ncbi:MAG: lycopene cyclase domain-containing protein [Anaerolineae bacterium]|nr:lycopene cyclase domain-containing protein [Anaerolineae bacterium]